MKLKLKSKFKSYKFWTSLSAAIVVIVEVIGRAVGFIPNGDILNDIIMGICGVLVVLGFVNPSKDELELNQEDEENSNDNK